MRHVDIKGYSPDSEWLARAETLLARLDAAERPGERAEVIDRHRSHWGGLKDALLALSGGKCWFSEARDCFSHWDVEHYRPKKEARDLDGGRTEGYWWLAFDWTNLRICGNVGNRKKGGYFPLRSDSQRATRWDDIRAEEPLLLDPVDQDDPALLSFDLEGRAIVAPHVADEWEQTRVRYSVERYRLDFPALMDKRKVVWAACWDASQEYLKELEAYNVSRSPVARDRSKQAVRRLRELLDPSAELSAVARACLLSTGEPRLTAIVGSI